MTVGPQIYFQNYVNNLYLTITLRLIGRSEVQFGATKPMDFFPKFRYKDLVSIRDYRGRNPMQFDNISDKYLKNLGGIEISR